MRNRLRASGAGCPGFRGVRCAPACGTGRDRCDAMDTPRTDRDRAEALAAIRYPHDPTERPPVCPTVDGADLLRDLSAAWPHLTRAERLVLLRVAQEAREHCDRLGRAVGAATDAARHRGAR